VLLVRNNRDGRLDLGAIALETELKEMRLKAGNRRVAMRMRDGWGGGVAVVGGSRAAGQEYVHSSAEEE